MSSTFVALDLDGPVRNLALCDAAPAGGLDGPGWPIRASILRTRSWLVGEADQGWHEDEIRSALDRWEVRLERTPLVVLGHTGADDPCPHAKTLGAALVCLPRHRHIISPRGIVPAALLMHYARDLDPPVPPDLGGLRDPFVDLMESAADDVQAAGYEQDDSIVDRYVALRWAEGIRSSVVPIESLIDADWFASIVGNACIDRWGEAPELHDMQVVSVHLRCAVELPDAFPVRLAPSDGELARAITGTASHAAPPCYRRAALLAGDAGEGPATFVDAQTTIQVADGWSWQITTMGHLICRTLSSRVEYA